MKYDASARTVELTTRNLKALSDKLDDLQSARTLASPCGQLRVRAVEDVDRADGQAAAGTAEGIVLVTRSELTELLDGETVTVGGIVVVPVPDAAHYSTRPSGIIFSPSAGEVIGPDTSHWRLRHICEVCRRDEILTPAAAYEAGWDYPPRMGRFGVISPRVCPSCPTEKSAWWAVTVDGYTAEMLSEQQRETVARILGEPGSISVEEP